MTRQLCRGDRDQRTRAAELHRLAGREDDLGDAFAIEVVEDLLELGGHAASASIASRAWPHVAAASGVGRATRIDRRLRGWNAANVLNASSVSCAPSPCGTPPTPVPSAGNVIVR